jgi:hypothetical protein
VKLLEAEPAQAPAPAAAPPAPAEPAGEAPAPARACRSCGAPMLPEQDWCLSCGTAAPGRLGRRPGWRAAATVAALTLTLVGGSVAAAYAALTTDATQEAAAPPPPAASPIAQAPPTTPPSSATPPPATDLPTVKAPGTSKPSGGGDVKTVSPPTHTTPSTTPPVHPVSPAHDNGGTEAKGGGTGTKGGKKDDGKSPAPAPEPTGPVAIELPGDAGALYDPGAQADTPGDASLAIDGDPTTAFDLGALSDAWDLGYAIDLQSRRGLRQVRIETDTPGFEVEVYGTASRKPPATIDDPAWTKLHDTVAVGAKKPLTKIKLGDGTKKYRQLLLWVTAGPTAGGRVHLGEVTAFE